MYNIISKSTIPIGTFLLSIIFFACNDSAILPEQVLEKSDNVNKVTESVHIPVSINFSLFFTGPNTAVGNFTMTGAANGAGSVQQDFRVSGNNNIPHTVHGKKTLTTNDGEFIVLFQVKIVPTSPTTADADGQFVIQNGSGFFTGFHGEGAAHIDIDFAAGTLSGSYEGFAHFDNRN